MQNIIWSVAYLGFHFGGGGGGSIFFGSHAFARGVRGGMILRENFKKWCNLVRFGEYFAKI